MVVDIEQGYIDSLALSECKLESNLYEAKFDAMMMQSESFSNQLNLLTFKFNDLQKSDAKKKKWNQLGLVSALIGGLVAGVFIAK